MVPCSNQNQSSVVIWRGAARFANVSSEAEGQIGRHETGAPTLLHRHAEPLFITQISKLILRFHDFRVAVYPSAVA